MLQFENLSAAGRNIVENFISGSFITIANKKKQLVVSLYSLLEEAKPEVLEILSSYKIDLDESFSGDELFVLTKESKAAIRYCHEKKEPDMGFSRPSDNHSLMIPQSLMDLCDELLDTEKGDEVFLPYASSTQIAFSKPECKFEGFEVNAETWAFSQIYLFAYDINADIQCTANMGDAIPDGKQYDFIFSFPPYMVGRECRAVVNNLYHLATKSLKEDGTLCCILPLSFCTATSGWFDIRKMLYDYHNQYSAAVISLPRMLFPYTAVEICLFLLKKDRQGKVLLVDATSDTFCLRHDAAGWKEYELKPQAIIETIKGRDGRYDERYVWVGLTSHLIGDVNLLPSRYLINQHLPQAKKGEQLLPLREIIEFVPTGRNDDEDIPLLGMKELSSSYLNCDIQRESVPVRPNHHFRTLNENCLLVGFMGGKFKVGRTVDLSSEHPVALRHEVISFRLKTNIVSEDFLLRSLMSDNVALQGKMMSSGATIARIKKQDFLDLMIVVPSLEEQNRLCKADTKQSLTDADIKQKKTDDDFRRDMHMKKHAIGQTIFNLNNWWKTLLRAREEGNGIVDDCAIIGRTQKVAVKDIYTNIQQAIELLQQQISKFDRGNGLTTENITLTSFIEGYISKHKSPLFHFEYDAASHYHYMAYGGEDVYDEKGNIIALNNVKEGEMTFEHAVFAPEALTIIFDNIVSNACSHGFVGGEENPDDNIIKIELYTEGTDHVITISNNGKAVREDVTQDYVFTYNKSTQNGRNHYGIGGYEVKRLMQEFDGDAEFISRPTEKFPVTYKLIFHNTGIETFNLSDLLETEAQ